MHPLDSEFISSQKDSGPFTVQNGSQWKVHYSVYQPLVLFSILSKPHCLITWQSLHRDTCCLCAFACKCWAIICENRLKTSNRKHAIIWKNKKYISSKVTEGVANFVPVINSYWSYWKRSFIDENESDEISITITLQYKMISKQLKKLQQEIKENKKPTEKNSKRRQRVIQFTVLSLHWPLDNSPSSSRVHTCDNTTALKSLVQRFCSPALFCNCPLRWAKSITADAASPGTRLWGRWKVTCRGQSRVEARLSCGGLCSQLLTNTLHLSQQRREPFETINHNGSVGESVEAPAENSQQQRSKQ